MTFEGPYERAGTQLSLFCEQMIKKYPPLEEMCRVDKLKGSKEDQVYTFLLLGAHSEIDSHDQLISPDYYEFCRLRETRTEAGNIRNGVGKKANHIMEW